MYPLQRTSSPTSPREDNDHQPAILPLLGVEVTGYRLLTTGVILGFGIPKGVYSYKGQALISTTLDWVAGVIVALVLFWLGEAKRPGLFPRFYHEDLAPHILRFIRRPEVYAWFLSASPLLISTMLLWATLDSRRNHEHASNIPPSVIEDGLIMLLLAFITAICIFCLQCVMVIRPKAFEGLGRATLLFIVTLATWITYLYVFISCHPSFIEVAVHNIVWMCPLPFMLPFIRRTRHIRENEHRNEMLLHIMMNE